MPEAPLLSVHGLRCGYGGKPVLQGVDLEVRAGEIVAVIGRNGVGKSTLIKALMGLLPADAGSIHFRGAQINAVAAHRRARLGIGYVPQGRDVFPRLSVEENLAVGEAIGGGGTADYERMYRSFPILWERRRQVAGTLSGGQQQRTSIARALYNGRPIVIGDEPVSALDRRQGAAVLRRMADAHATMILALHDVPLALEYASRIVVLEAGRIALDAPAASLREADLARFYG